jgi:predicted CXXCH cytochrome family protein
MIDNTHSSLRTACGVLLLWLGISAGGPACASDTQPPRKASEALALTGKNARVENGKKFFGEGQYAGSESCKACHESQYQSWTTTWHSKMERWPTADTVVGDFNNRRMQFRNLRVRGQDGKETMISPAALAFRKGDKFFFTLIDNDNAANSQTWEIAKVLGGKWDQGYEVRLGLDNYLPAPIRWSVEQQDWIIVGFNPQDWFLADGTPDGRPFTPAEMPTRRVAEAKCNGCHTTGFTYAKASDGVWKAHMKGQGEIAIACESCHGPGARHVDEANVAKSSGHRLTAGKTSIVNPLTDLNAEQATQVCGQCHGRGTHKEATELSFPTGFLPGDTDLKSRFRLWSFSGTNNKAESDYFWSNDWASRNRQQTQDFSKSGHANKAGMSCITCHAFHGKTEPAQLRSKPEALCVECHRSDARAMRPNAEMFAGSRHDEAGVTCVDCHMARIGSRSRATSKSGHSWDATSHVFAVPTPLMERTLGVRSACTSCHFDGDQVMATGATANRRSTQQELIDDMRQRSDEIRAGVAEVQAMLAKVDIRKPKAVTFANEARSKIAFVVMDNSKGMHNIGLTRQLLSEAKVLANRAVAK